MPHLSIIISVYNRAKDNEIGRCLEAIRLSTYHDYELIVIDANSQDETVTIARKYADKVIELDQRCGRTTAHNVGIKEAKGDILVFTDSDNIVRQDTLSRINDFFMRHPEADAVVGLVSKEHPNPDFFSQYKNLYMHYRLSKLPSRITFLQGDINAVKAKAAVVICEGVITDDTERGQRIFLSGKQIFFLKDLEVVHLKKYSLVSFVINDFQIPFDWAKIFVRYKGWKQLGKHDTGYCHAPKEQLMSIILIYPITVLIMMTVFGTSTRLITSIMCLIWLLSNIKFFVFLAREKNIYFLITSIFVTFFDNLVMASGIICGFFSEIMNQMRSGRVG
ncbi:MAG: glycosyltransferase [Candidatus Omnitrophica bacterium]|nr:glycosyltransferase [Candidatus Omnitrophota bacterium]MDD5653126.1 glycosyltransferase [Candidatus Omnitrophota bacterium]